MINSDNVKNKTCMPAKIRKGLTAIAVFLLVSVHMHAQSLQFYQLSFDYGGPFYSDSDWGAADLTFIGDTSTIFYFNLTVDTTWAVENIPILSVNGHAISQTQRIWFDIGDSGVYINSLGYGFSLTPDTIALKPALTNSTTVSPYVVITHSGAAGNPGTGDPPPPADKQKGGKVISAAPTNHDGFPNQECGKNECVPAAISNSLQWLNAYHNLTMNPSDISITSLGIGLKKDTTGVNKDSIVDRKQKYCIAKKLPVTTQKVRAQEFESIIKEMNDAQDVELILKKLDGGYHAVSVIGIAKIKTGKFAVTISEDTQQGCVGGTMSELAIFDKYFDQWGPKWSGALSYATRLLSDFYFVVECPVKVNKQQNKNGPGGSKHKSVSGRSSQFGSNKYHIKNLELGGYSNTTLPPALGNTSTLSFSGTAAVELSSDSGLTFSNYTSPYSASIKYNHMLDSSGKEYYYTELISFAMSGGSLPPNIFLRENPAMADSSMGLLVIEQVLPAEFNMSHYIDAVFELSDDGGASWMPDDNRTGVLYMDEDSLLTGVSYLHQETNMSGNTLFLSSGNNTIVFKDLENGCRFEVYDMIGHEVYHSSNYKNDFSVSHLPAGMYIFLLHLQNNNSSNGKFVVVK